MTPEVQFWLLLAIGAAAGGFINGLAGFGTALFALGFWLQIMTPHQAVAMALVMSVVSGIQGVFLVRKSIEPLRLATFAVPALIGVPLGVWSLTFLSPLVLKIVIAIFLISYGAFFTFRKTLPKFEREVPVLDGIIGFVAGILGGAASLSGSIPTMWLALRPWTKERVRGVLQPFNVAILGFAIVMFALQGVFTGQVLLWLLAAFPITMIAAQNGIATFKRLNDEAFRRLLIALMLLSGLVLAARTLLLD